MGMWIWYGSFVRKDKSDIAKGLKSVGGGIQAWAMS